MTASLNAAGKMPSERDKLMRLVIGVIKISINSMTRKVGQGSRQQDLGGEDLIILSTSSSPTGENTSNLAEWESLPLYEAGMKFGVFGNADRILLILSVKKDANELASALSEVCLGKTGSLDLCRSLLSSLHSLFWIVYIIGNSVSVSFVFRIRSKAITEVDLLHQFNAEEGRPVFPPESLILATETSLEQDIGGHPAIQFRF